MKSTRLHCPTPYLISSRGGSHAPELNRALVLNPGIFDSFRLTFLKWYRLPFKREWVCFFLLIPGLSYGVVLQTLEQALTKVCGEGKQHQQKNAYLSKEQIKFVNQSMEYKIKEQSTLVTYYECQASPTSIHYAYLDSDTVRHETQTLMIGINSENELGDVEVLNFSEPKEYMAPPLWIAQFKGKSKEQMEKNKLNIVGITGATLTSKAVVKATQKILALHALIHPPLSELKKLNPI